MIPVEVGEPSYRRLTFHKEQNEGELRNELDSLDEVRNLAMIKEKVCKLHASWRYNSKMKPRSFHEGDLIWRATGEAKKDTSAGKFTVNWEGPFRVV
uniref:Uncharacterized protein n=1 Tax=Cajanus cajan TaxID=3821 RepID=A0A151RHV1_CAJCA|nr:hypothetical protein KK1_036460 [Cajanus cajan]